MKTKKVAPSQKKLIPEIEELETLVGNFIQYWGFKKIHGRIWAHLYTSDTPLDSQTLMNRLNVSKALMSLAIRDLLKHEVIQNDSVGKYGVTFYHANPDVIYVITNVLRKREAVMISSFCSCLSRITSKNNQELNKAGLNLTKLQNLKNMGESAQGLLNLFILQSTLHNNLDNTNIFSEFKTESNL
jgi:DNA-binding transcriptional regulator GbsR (MarR family)